MCFSTRASGGGAKAELQPAGHDVLWTGDLAQDQGDEVILGPGTQGGRGLITLGREKVSGEEKRCQKRKVSGPFSEVEVKGPDTFSGSYLQKQASTVNEFRDLRNNPTSAFVLGAILVFFVLAGLYEGWSLPLAVILVVPMCVLCALAGVFVRGLDNNLFTQIGFVVLIGLACKNAILIVEFARARQLEGTSAFDAAREAASVRLRPIVMTTFCFIHMVPPYFASVAGAEMRRSVGTAMPGARSHSSRARAASTSPAGTDPGAGIAGLPSI